jgi:hypothetical protein
MGKVGERDLQNTCRKGSHLLGQRQREKKIGAAGEKKREWFFFAVRKKRSTQRKGLCRKVRYVVTRRRSVDVGLPYPTRMNEDM